MKTVKDLKKWLEKYDDDTPVKMCMDWTELEDEGKPEHLKGQWHDELGDLAYDGKSVILLNKNFK